MVKLEPDGLLSVKNPPSGSMSFQADYFARQHPVTLNDIRDFYDLTSRYYEKLLADRFPETVATRKLYLERRARLSA